MSEQALRQFLDRLAADSTYAEQVKANPTEALGEYELSATERVALASGDEDALRRLTGGDVAGFGPFGEWAWGPPPPIVQNFITVPPSCHTAQLIFCP